MAHVVPKHEPLIERTYTRFRMYESNELPGTYTPNGTEHGFLAHDCVNDVIDLMQAFIDKFPKSPRKRSLSM
jgi:hypothetical protein